MKRMRDTLLTVGLAVIGMLCIPAFASMSLVQESTPKAQAQTMCTMQYDPVCAAQPVQCFTTPCYPQYQTFGNSCMAAASGATVIHRGECLPHETGPVYPTPPPPPPPPKPVYTPPANCVAWYDGCNSCSKQTDGSTICTKRACSVHNTTQGYCTAYQQPTPPVVTPPPPVYYPPYYHPQPRYWWMWWWPWRYW